MPFYAVRTGRFPGVYGSWDECKRQVDKFAQARYKKFNTEHEATEFVNGFDTASHGQDRSLSSNISVQSAASNNHSTTHNARSLPNHNYSHQQTCHQNAPKPTSSKSQSKSTAIQLQIAEKEMEGLREKLKLKGSEKKLLQTKNELQQLKDHCRVKHQGKSNPMKHTSHISKPYKRKQSTASSANWKQNRTTQLIGIDEARQIHTTTLHESSNSNGGSPVVYTDGACVNNGHDGAKAGIGVYWGPDHPLNTSERLEGRQTNNRAEIHAVVKAVKQARDQGFDELTVKTDSMFLINSMTKWLPGWQKKNWQTAAGKPVINRDDFEALLNEMDGIQINWVHVRGHQGIEGNEKADNLAVEGAKKLYLPSVQF